MNGDGFLYKLLTLAKPGSLLSMQPQSPLFNANMDPRDFIGINYDTRKTLIQKLGQNFTDVL